MDGYRSASLKKNIAKNFAARAEDDKKDKVLLKIILENETGLYYMMLDKEDYTCYPDEKEVILQAGLIAKIRSVEYDQTQELTTFNLYISEKMIKRHMI